MKIKHVLNLHKGLTSLVIVGLMLTYQNFTLGPWIYLALHGTYGLLWLLKDQIYPDRQWGQEIPTGQGIFSFGLIALYWVAPFLLISRGTVPSLPLVALAICLNLVGILALLNEDMNHWGIGTSQNLR